MNEKEKEIIRVIAAALPHMSEFDKGYFLGVAESKVEKKQKLSSRIKDMCQVN